MKLNCFNIFKAAALPAVALFAFNCGAMPSANQKIMVADGKGGLKEVVVTGDEFCHALLSPDRKIRYERDPRGILQKAGDFDETIFAELHKIRANKRRLKGSPTFPAYGKQRALAVLVEFPQTDLHPEGRKFTSENPLELFRNLLNADDYSHDGAAGSVREYFLDSSNSTLDLTFDVFGPVMLKHDLTHYLDKKGGEEIYAWEMVVEACQAIDSYVDFSDYDRDHDGIIDNVYIFYAGPGAATGGDPSDCIWQHASDVELLSGKQHIFDGLRLNHYACSNEYRDVKDEETGKTIRLTEGIGTVCHEFSHVLGLPDLYDVYYGGHTSPGLWDVMDTGCHLNQSRTPAAYSALDRILMGWLEPESIGDTPRSLSLPAISSNKAYMIPTSDNDEFFLLENRQQSGWDAHLPGHGMILWRVNYKKDFWDKNQVNTGKGKSHAFIIPADGRNGEPSYDGDPFPGSGKVRDISDNGYPNMLSSEGIPTNAPISSITEAGGVISFDICKAVTSLDKVTGVSASDITPASFLLSWNPLPLSPGYEVTVTNAEGAPVGIYDNLNVANTALVVTGLQPASSYNVVVCGVAGKIRGEYSDPLSVFTPEMSFIYTAPSALNVDVVSHDSCALSWEALPEAVDYCWTLYSATIGDDRFAAADFKGGLESIPAGWSTNALSTISINGFFGLEAPALSLTTDLGRIQSPTVDNSVKAFEFWYRERNPSGHSYIAIETLTDKNWTVADRILLQSSMTEGSTYSLKSEDMPNDVKAVRIIYHRVDKGSLAVDDVKITYEGETTLTPIAGFTDQLTGSALPSAEIKGLSPETEYILRLRGVNAENQFSSVSDPLTILTVKESGILNLTDDLNYDTQWFDLQGNRVNPDKTLKGIYIIKSDSGVKKIIK